MRAHETSSLLHTLMMLKENIKESGNQPLCCLPDSLPEGLTLKIYWAKDIMYGC